jgi:predicted transcriptional regulator
MDKNKILEKMGLTKHESAIYLGLLELGPSNISQISEKAAIHRPLIYKALPALLEKKLITQNRRHNRMVYMAEPPNRLEAIFDDLKIDFFEILPDLEDSYLSNEQKPKVRFLEGKDGTKRIFDDIDMLILVDTVLVEFANATANVNPTTNPKRHHTEVVTRVFENNTFEVWKQEKADDCGVCTETTLTFTTCCRKSLCKTCFCRWVFNEAKDTCPFCRELIDNE